MPVIKIKPVAYNDMTEIWYYVAENSSNEQADKLIDRLEAKVRFLAESPKIGRLRPELLESLRSFPVGRYIILRPVKLPPCDRENLHAADLARFC